MITWIQKYFQRHFRTVFAVMLALMVISLVGYYNASSGFGRGGDERERVSRPFLGLDLASPEDAGRLLSDANLSRTLQIGFQLPADERLESYAQLRHAALWLADQFHLAAPGKAELDAYVRTLRAFASPETGQFDAGRYNSVLDSLDTDPRLTRADLARVLVDDIRFNEVERLIAGPGFLLPSESAAILELNESSWTLAVANVDYASFAPAIAAPTPTELEKFFTADQARYEIHPQVRVDAIEFPAESFLSKVTVTDKELRAFYDTNPVAFTKPEDKSAVPPMLAKPDDKPADKPEDKAAKADAAFAAARSKVEEVLKLDRARRLAATAAADLSFELYKLKTTPATLAPVLATRALTLKPLAPFAKDAPPAELGSAAQAAAAFGLKADEPFSDGLPTEHGAVVLVWRENIPARQPSFAEVRDRVAADWQADEKHRRFTELGRDLRARLETALKAGTPFEQAVAAAETAASSAKLEVKNYSGFTLAQKRESGSFDPLAPTLDRLTTLQKGQLTEMITVRSSDGKTTEKGLLVLAVDKKLPDLTTPESKAMSARLKLQFAAYSANETLVELVQAELKKFDTAKP